MHVTSVHSGDDVRIRYKEVRALSGGGFDVTLITQRSGRLLNDGVRLVIVPASSGRLARFLFAPFRLAVVISSIHPRIIHFHDPELLPLGLWLAFRRQQVIYDVHEDTPRQILDKHYLPQILRRPLAWLVETLERASFNSFAAFAVATPEIGRRFPASKTVLVQNFPQLSEFNIVNIDNYDDRGPNFAYVGGITAARGAREMVQALYLATQSTNVVLKLAGKFNQSLQQELEALPGWKHVDFVGWVDRDATVDLLRECRAGLVLFHPDANHVKAQPNKMFEYMAAGLPVIASDFPLWREIIAGADCGILVDPLDPQAIATAMRWIIDHPEESRAMGERGQKAVKEHYNWEIEQKGLVALYRRLVGTPDLTPTTP
ncbi:MAG TPA: glycosyltransferase family 4 protein [Devosiaceae bacterium]